MADTASPPAATTAATAQVEDQVVQNEFITADEAHDDSAYATSESTSTSSLTSSLYRGVIRNGRRYQTLAEEDAYYAPSDEKQFESQNLGHIVYTVLEDAIGGGGNPHFRAPIGEEDGSEKHVLDVGCGEGSWAVDVADRWANLTVRGVDLYPPPQSWTPPNCIFEVDDVTKPWTWAEKFDLVHLRWMVATFDDKGWENIYRQAYENLKPGGWIEHLETSVAPECEDNSVPPDSFIANWGPLMYRLGERAGRKMDTIDTMRSRIEKAGFINVHEKVYKVPTGGWAKNKLLKEVGKIRLQEFLGGVEGYITYLMMTFGEPEPWTMDQIQAFLAKTREEFNKPELHHFTRSRRVWAQKPFDA